MSSLTILLASTEPDGPRIFDAISGIASSTERSLAYRRAQKLIESLETVHVPQKAIAQLEERQQLMITSS